MDIYGNKLNELKRRAKRNGAHNIENRVIESTKAIKKLRLMVHTTATVVRKNDIESEDEEQIFPLTKVEKREVEISKLVPGDVIHLSAGDIIPADVRLISSKDLFINNIIL